MTDYTLNTPASNQLQSVSQGIMLDNCNALDERFGIDHYEYSLALPPSGYHKQVTTPDRGSHPSGATYPALYGKAEATTNLGLMQYVKPVDRASEGGNQISTPITFIQSDENSLSINNAATINIFDFTGITRCFARLTVGNIASGTPLLTIADMWWRGTGSVGYLKLSGDSTKLVPSFSANTLIVTNSEGSTINNVFWTLEFSRIQI